MGARTRTQDIGSSIIGTVYNEKGNYLTSQGPVYIGMNKVTDDVVGNREGFNNLHISEIHRRGGLVNGIRRHSNGGVFRTFYDFPLACLTHTVPDPTGSGGFVIDPIRLNEYALQLLAATNPGRVHVNLPAFVAELKDLPSLVLGYGRSVLRNLSVAHLQYRWGWRPLLSDLRSLLLFQKLTAKRFQELDRLRAGKKLKKGKFLDSGLKTKVSSGFIANSQQLSLSGQWVDTYTNRVWGTVQWYCPNWDNPFKGETDEEFNLHATDILTGINSAGALAAAWEIIPWSWLVDWFSNVGDLIDATANSTDFRHRGLCIMQNAKLIRVLDATLPGGLYELEMEPVIRIHEKKKRFAVPYVLAFPTFRLPILTDKKLSIIGALSVLRFTPEDQRTFKRAGKKR